MTQQDQAADGTAVIVGAGQAGLTAAVSLRDNGWRGPIQLIGNEAGDPYQRPPLSKGYLAGTETDDDLVLRALRLLERDDIRYLSDVSVDSIDPGRSAVRLSNGHSLDYDQLILATGATSRSLSVPGAQMDGVFLLRSRTDAVALRAALAESADVVVIGGGFLGLEVAAHAALGSRVSVLERSGQLLSRSVSAPIAAALARAHGQNGTSIRYGTSVSAIRHDGRRATGVVYSDNQVIPADVVVVAIGAVPNVTLAQEAGLDVANGIVVDEFLRTSDPRIRAIGDCARHPNHHAERTVRLESVQNAVDQARYVARDLTASDGLPYRSVPWFWSHQGDQNLQIAGVADPSDSAEVDVVDSKMTVTRLRDGRIVAVETLNNPRAHIRARRMLADGPVPAQLSA